LDRIYFSKTSNTWRLEQDDGTELEYDSAKSSWVPLVSGVSLLRRPAIPECSQVDEDLISRQQAAYSVAGVDEEVRLGIYFDFLFFF
jgi:HIV Tat-specific factor 1